ncbi:probable cyclic nucleotide-gated ion channel 20, chloroplastic [Lolium rigidum]|uniref:probable cyclic nucleotide-gated ion channel 20, chloroplastic n=1 Tax=Lolium rigidum TaxID=89674 RepID=UPI001F5C3151|nr:probable cyclic nucleotide-gated ion channel 20, chloroplastic [Lolium rigidum]
MADQERDDIPMLLRNVELPKFPRSTSMCMPMRDEDYEEDTYVPHTGPLSSQPPAQTASGNPFVGRRTPDRPPRHPQVKPVSKPQAVMPEEAGGNRWSHGGDGPKNEHLMMSGPLGQCDNPDCVNCPPACKNKRYFQRAPHHFDNKLHNILYAHQRGWKKSIERFLSYIPIMNPHAKVVQQWNQFFVISCLVAIFIDPLFFFLLSVQKDNKCIVLNWKFATGLAVVRSVSDAIYFMHMLLQFRLAYVAPESRVVGAGDLVDEPKKIAVHYLRGHFLLDFFVLLPLPQVMILVVIPRYVGLSTADIAKNYLRVTVLLQYVPRILRFVPLLGGNQSATGFIFESAWANFVINLLMFVMSGHVVGSCWYLFGLQRVNQCLQNACSASKIPSCEVFRDCGRDFDTVGQPGLNWQKWYNDSASTSCFSTGDGSTFKYGIYQEAVLLATKRSAITRYIYSLFWGFQQISTLAGNLVPSYFEGEVLFTMAIVGLGLLLFALLIGNMQNFLQALGSRKLEMQLRRRDVEKWMSHRRLPEELRRRVRHAERFTWAATQGVNEEELLSNLPEDIQRDIRRHFFRFLNKVRLFTLMDWPILDAICDKLRQNLYISGSDILYQGGPVDKMVFIVRGKLESISADGSRAPLHDGDVCGEELLTWYLEHSSANKDGGKSRFHGMRLVAIRTVTCLTNVEAFVLRASDLEQVTSQFARFLRNPRVQGAIRYESPYWRTIAAARIQVAWRYRKRRLKRAERSRPSEEPDRKPTWSHYAFQH